MNWSQFNLRGVPYKQNADLKIKKENERRSSVASMNQPRYSNAHETSGSLCEMGLASDSINLGLNSARSSLSKGNSPAKKQVVRRKHDLKNKGLPESFIRSL